MVIEIVNYPDKLPVIRYFRDDGTVVWQPVNSFFVLHDLAHYALEKVLGFRTAFLGLVNQGLHPQDFEEAEKRKAISLTAEAWNAENMANLFLTEWAQGEWDDFNQVAAAAYAQQHDPGSFRPLSSAEIFSIRQLIRDLFQQWEHLPEDEKMILSF
ncbi:MAG: hypothetical protein ACKO6K_08990 [Chitinophagaceae bacterium]